MTILEITNTKSKAITAYVNEVKDLLKSNFSVQLRNWTDVFFTPASYKHFHYGNSTVQVILPLLFSQSQNIVTIHDVMPRNKNKKSLAKLLFSIINWKAKTIITHSKHAKELLHTTYPYIPKDKVIVIPYGSLPKKTNPADQDYLQHAFNINGTDIIFMQLGYIKKAKGIEQVVQAFQTVKHPKAKLIIIGKAVDEETAEFLKTIRQSNIRAAGFLPDKELEMLLQRADCLINIRLDSVGETSAAVMNALNHGIPVIASSIGSNPEVIGKAGILIEPTVEQITTAITNFVENGKLRSSLKIEVSKHTKHLSWERQLPVYTNIFRV